MPREEGWDLGNPGAGWGPEHWEREEEVVLIPEAEDAPAALSAWAGWSSGHRESDRLRRQRGRPTGRASYRFFLVPEKGQKFNFPKRILLTGCYPLAHSY